MKHKRIITSPGIINKLNDIDYNYNWLNDLVKATLKANIMILMYNPMSNSKIDSQFYQNIKLSNFIHRVYIETAIELWNNPYLLYHKYPPIEIKRNHRDCLLIIKDSIKEAIRKLLPVKHILHVYLGEDLDINNINQDNKIGKVISEAEENYITKLMNQDLNKKAIEEPLGSKIRELRSPAKLENEPKKQSNDSIILEIINRKSTNNTDIITSEVDIIPIESKIRSLGSAHLAQNVPRGSEGESKAFSPLIVPIQAKLGLLGEKVKPENLPGKTKPLANIALEMASQQPEENKLDLTIKKILHDDLSMRETDIETSLHYSPENKYQAIFINSIHKQ